ncbi:hypothetical protein KR074_001189 [Drosophila pseudoananassae]|nr:hypothetical protein KR074_001189 [Drosophila pseudoananassae]
MSSSVFTEAPSRPAALDADSNLVVVYGKNGISFDERAIENIMEEKSISTISVVRLTSPTPSMVDQEEAERLEELERFLDTASDSELDSDNASQSGGDDARSDGEAPDEENENSSDENHGDSTESEPDAPRLRRRPGRKPKAIKKKKRRKPKERPQIVGLRVEQFYADGTANMVVKNALKLAGVPMFKRTPETDAIMNVIRNDHNYTPFTSPEQLNNHKRAEKMATDVQSQNRKIIIQAPGSIKVINAKKRVQAMPFSPLQVKIQRLPTKLPQLQQQSPVQVHLQKKIIQQPLPRQKPEIIPSTVNHNIRLRPVRAPVKVMAHVEEHIEDDEDAQSSDPADEENADKSYDTEEPSEESDEFQDSDNDRDSDIDFNMRGSGGRNTSKRKRVRKIVKPPPARPAKPLSTPPSATPQFPDLKRRKEQVDLRAPQIGQIIQLPPRAPSGVIALGKSIPSTSFLKARPPTHQALPVKKLPLPGGTLSGAVVGRILNNSSRGVFKNSSQDVKEIIINKNMASPKGVFTNLNSLLGDNNNATIKASPDPQRHRQIMSPSTPRSSYSIQQSTPVTPKPITPTPSKGFMPIGVNTAQSHKLPAQIVIETHQSSSELAAENDKQLDLINSIVQDELLKSTLVEQPPVNADENIPKLVKMLESTAASLDPAPVNPVFPETANSASVDPIDEDEITADFLQHVVELIEEDKQFEAEVVKQVLASTEPGELDAIVSLPTPVAPVSLPHSLNIQPQTNLPLNAVIVEPPAPLSAMPIACSTPSRTQTISMTPSAKIVRGNGRVIYLPPMEAPTTRAKRRAQIPTAGDQSMSESILDTSSEQLANTSGLSLDSLPGVGPKRPNPREPSLARRSTAPRRTKKLNTSQTTDPEASESQEDDDDPNKLWCICRQPHNNRFMICCDMCEDWYHGSCVSVTKAMGTEMENKGIDWKCPKCVKQLEEKSQPRITEMLRPAISSEEKPTETKVFSTSLDSVKAISPAVQKRVLPVGVTVARSPLRSPIMKPSIKRPANAIPHQQQQLNFIKLGPLPGNRTVDTQCVVCKRPASPNSVYCGDECIRKYAQSAVQAHPSSKQSDGPLAHKKKDLFEDMLRQADSMSKVERVSHPLSFLCGLSRYNLFNFQINVFERKSGRVIIGHLAPTLHQFRKWLQDNPTFEVLPSGTLQSADPEKRQLKRGPEPSSNQEFMASVATTSTVAKKPLEVAIKSPQPATTPTLVRALPKKDKERTSPALMASVASTSRSATKPEPVRIGIRRSLKEQLLARIKEAQDEEKASSQGASTKWLTDAEVDHFVKAVESEMYHSFGRDVGAKYKSKYRSLMFNIKDRKNRTLFEKICAKQVEPKQLVRMTPEQLASQELAKWREEENRHQLDMIKKSELDMLYVVSTHKGEEVVTSKVDVTLPEEEASEASPVEKKPGLDTSVTERSSSKGKSSSSKEKRHKSHKHHHHRKRSRSRSTSRSRSQDKRHRKHPNEPEALGSPPGGGDHHSVEKQGKEEIEGGFPSPLSKKREESNLSPTVKKMENPNKKSEVTTYNLIDQILESEKTVEQAANLEKPTKPAAKPLPTLPPSMDHYARYVHSLSTTSLWSGNLKMVEVTDFNVVIHPVFGECTQLGKLFPPQLDVIGRITRVNVWEYLKKLRKTPTKEVVIVNFFPASPSETPKFNLFYEYLDSRQRLGVLGTNSDQIRDFYIFPFGSRDVLPPELKRAERVPFYDDEHRPNTFLGIIVRCLSKRSAMSTPNSLSPTPTVTPPILSVTKKSRRTCNFTPPSSPKRKASTHSTSSKDEEFDIDAIIKAPIAKLQKTAPKLPTAPLDDADEPYSPGGSDDEQPPPAPRIANDLERQVDEINKQIAAQQMEIAGLLKVEPKGSASSSKVLAGISIPPNLSKILASIKDKALGEEDEEYNPEDAITTPSTYATKPKSKGRLAHLSEAELLSMVPDGVMPSTSKTRHQQSPPPLPPPPPPPGV